MKMKLRAAILVVLVVGTRLGAADEPVKDSARDAKTSATAATAPAYAFLFGESIAKEEGGGFGINVSRIDWWIGDPDGKNLRRLDDPKKGRLRVRPVDRTIILKRDDKSLTLLGPDGGDLTLSLTDGPLTKTEFDDVNMTTFSFTPDGKGVVFVNKKGAICRFAIGSKDLAVVDNTAVDPSRGIQFSPNGSLMAYLKHFRKDDFSPVVFSVYVAKADGTGEKKLTEFNDGEQLGQGFLPDGRVGLVGPTSLRAIDPKTDKAEIIGEWRPFRFRAFGGFNPDGSTYIYDLGGPYVLNLYAFDIKAKRATPAKEQYLESFQQMVWVRVPGKGEADAGKAKAK